MDLTELLIDQTELDLRIANTRIIELSVRIRSAAAEIQQLRQIMNDQVVGYSANTEAVIDRKSADSSASNSPDPSNIDQSDLSYNLYSKKADIENRIIFYIDSISGQEPVKIDGHFSYTFDRAHFHDCIIHGWAVPDDLAQPFIDMEIFFGDGQDRRHFRSVAIDRPDIGAHLGRSALSQAGFSFHIAHSEIDPGSYKIIFSGVTSAGLIYRAQFMDLKVT